MTKLWMSLRCTVMILGMLSVLGLGSSAQAQDASFVDQRLEQALRTDLANVDRRWDLLEGLSRIANVSREDYAAVHKQVKELDQAAQLERGMTLGYLETLGPDQIGPLHTAIKRYFLAELAYFDAMAVAERDPRLSPDLHTQELGREARVRSNNGLWLLASLEQVIEAQRTLLSVAAESGIDLDPAWGHARQKALLESYRVMAQPDNGPFSR